MKIVITGSSTGIGRAVAERLAARGHEVWGLARSDQADFVARHRTVRASRCDVADWGQVARAAQDVQSQWTHVDALVTCAAIHGPIGRALDVDPVKWSAAVRVNLDGTFHALRAFDALLAKSPQRAKIVCFSGGGATQSRPNFSAYAAAKTAIVRLVETVADEAKGRALDINAVAPGAIATRLTDEIIQLGRGAVSDTELAAAEKAKAAGGAPLSQALDLVEWLLSPASDGITGRLLSATWDPWSGLADRKHTLGPDTYKLRRVLPGDSAR
jgi:NAD(P)-dependent dehydrogenase (short-subunit alcohol dehydrogenase family)